MLAAPGGTVVVVGIPSKDRMSFPASTARRKGLTIKFSRRMNRVYPDVIRIVEAGLIDVRSVVTASYPMSKVQGGLRRRSCSRGVKVVISPSAQPRLSGNAQGSRLVAMPQVTRGWS